MRWLIALFILAGLSSCDKPSDKKSRAVHVDLVVELVRVAASKTRTPEDVRPYDESLAWHEYQVKRVLSGELKDKVIRVAHWTVLHGKAVPLSTKIGEASTMKIAPWSEVEGIREVNASNDLDIVSEEPPRFLDLSQPLPAKVILADARCDYGGSLNDPMLLYWKLRGQLKLVAMGNSHATKGICTPEFFGNDNAIAPIAFNLAPPAAGVELQCLIIKDYVLPLPKIEWVVWVASARIFNEKRDEQRKYLEFVESRGRKYDLENAGKLWPVPASPLMTVKEIEQQLETLNVDWWGWDGRRKSLLDENEKIARQQIYKEIEKPDFVFSEPRWKLFTDTVRALNAKGVRVMLVTLPLHPVLRDSPAADPDGTSHEGMAEVCRRLAALHGELSLTWYHDFNEGEHHGFKHEDFYDADHVNRIAARTITRKIDAMMKECEAGKN